MKLWNWLLIFILFLFVWFNAPAQMVEPNPTYEQTSQDLKAVSESAGHIQKTIESVFEIGKKYGWQLLAIIGAPYLTWRSFQWLKLAHKQRFGEKPRWYLIDIGSWAMVWVLAYFAWTQHDMDGAAASAVVIALFHTTIIKLTFRFMPEKVVNVLQDGVYIEGQDKTLMATMLYGKRSNMRKKDRQTDSHEKTRILTQQERDEITGPR